MTPEATEDLILAGAQSDMSSVGIAEAVALSHECLVHGRSFEFISNIVDRDFEELYDRHVPVKHLKYLKLALAGAFVTILPWCYAHVLVTEDPCAPDHPGSSSGIIRIWDSWAAWLGCQVVDFARSPWVLVVAPAMLVIWRAANQLLPTRVQHRCRNKVFAALRPYLWRLEYHKNLLIFEFVAFGFAMVVAFSLVMCAILKSGIGLFCGCAISWAYLVVANHELSPGDEAIQLVEGKLQCWPPAPGFWPKLRTLRSTTCWVSLREAFAVEAHISPGFGEPQGVENDTSDPHASITADTKSMRASEDNHEECGVQVPVYELNKVSRRDLEARCYLSTVLLPELNKSIEVGSGLRLDDVEELAVMRRTPLDKIKVLECKPFFRSSRDILQCYNPHLSCRELTHCFQRCQRTTHACMEKVHTLESTSADLCRYVNSTGSGPVIGLPSGGDGHSEGNGTVDTEDSEDLGRSVFAVHSAAAALIK